MYLFLIWVARISIHALLAESDHFPGPDPVGDSQFLSTLSLRRATNIPNFTRKIKPDFYPRSPCGERRGTVTCRRGIPPISIHALLAESDTRQNQNL